MRVRARWEIDKYSRREWEGERRWCVTGWVLREESESCWAPDQTTSAAGCLSRDTLTNALPVGASGHEWYSSHPTRWYHLNCANFPSFSSSLKSRHIHCLQVYIPHIPQNMYNYPLSMHNSRQSVEASCRRLLYTDSPYRKKLGLSILLEKLPMLFRIFSLPNLKRR